MRIFAVNWKPRMLTFKIQHRFVDWLSACAPYLVPTALVIISALIILASRSQISALPTPHPVFAVEQTSQHWSVEQALSHLSQVSPKAYISTNRRESPFWFTFDMPKPTLDQAIEFPSRHATSLSCWATDSRTLLGEATRITTSGALYPVKAGWAIDRKNMPTNSAVVCKSEFKGPAKIEVKTWRAAELQQTAADYARSSGLLDGAGVMLVLFLYAVALFNREQLYALLGTWLFGNLRIAAISAGMDFTWLGFPIPVEWLYTVRQTTYALYYALTIVVFGMLFAEALKNKHRLLALRMMQYSIIPVLVLAAVLSYQKFLPVLWAAGITVIITQFALIATLPRHRRTSVTTLFGGALVLTLSGSVCEAIAGATGRLEITNWINHVSGALASSLLAALAVAAHIRRERTQRLQAQKKALRALDKVKDTYRASPMGLFTLDTETASFVRYNPAFAKMLGYVDGHSYSVAWNSHFKNADLAQIGDLHGGGKLEIELHGQTTKDDTRMYAISLVKSTAGAWAEGSIQDITARRAAEDRLRFLADHDPLTELLNRRGVEGALLRAIANAQEEGADKPNTSSLAYVDLDRFKLVNDLYGHDVGDETLVSITSIMKNLFTNCDIARVGGDEFLVVFNASLANAKLKCEHLIQTLRDRVIVVGDHGLRIECSIGLCEIEPNVLLHDVIATADRACRQAKTDKHASGLIVYDRSTTAIREHGQEVRLIEKLSASTELNGLYLQMQPIMSLEAPFAAHNFEVLLRMRDEQGAPVNVGKLISAAERAGLMPKIDRWVMWSVLEWLETHYAQLPNTNFVCMNLSGVSLNDERFINDTIEYLKTFPRAATMVCLEITEQVALQDLAYTRRWIDRLRALQCRVALDDFGAGYTSFSYLRDLPADALKIDGSFIKTLNAHPANFSIVQAIVALAVNLGMRTIAEWAEDVETVESLANLGVHYVQGWAICPAVDPEEILKHQCSADLITKPEVQKFVRGMELSPVKKFTQQLFPLGNRLK